MSRRRQRELSEREVAIVQLVGEFRLLDGAQLQRLVFAEGTVIGTRRRTQACLRRLAEEGYVVRLDRRVGGVRAGSASYCYSLGPKGQRLLDQGARGRRPTEPGLTFIRHHLSVAEVIVRVREVERVGDLDVIEYQAEPLCWRSFPRAFGGVDLVKPDLFISVGVGDFELRWFVEVDLGTESIRRVERACDRYVAYFRSGIEQAEHGVFPRVAWLANTPRRRAAIEAAIAKRPDDEQALFTVGDTNTSNETLKGGENEQQQTA